MSGDSFSELKLLTVSEVASILKMKEQAILKKLQNRDIKGYKLGKEWRIKEEDIMAWFEGRSNWNLVNELKSLLPADLVAKIENDLVDRGPGRQAKNGELLKRVVSLVRETGTVPDERVKEQARRKV
jgi:excisionase family DNA binding protein